MAEESRAAHTLGEADDVAFRVREERDRDVSSSVTGMIVFPPSSSALSSIACGSSAPT